jgi:hypothetical protein
VAIATVLKRFPNIRISTDKIEREPSLILRGMRALPVVF